MNNIPKEIQQCLGRLDNLQTEIFDKLNELINVSDPSQSLENDSIDFTRSKLSKQSSKLIIQYSNWLDVLKIKVDNYRYDDIEEKLNVIYDIYHEKLANLRYELKQSELESYKLEENFIHNQRMQRFGQVPEREKSWEEMKQELFAKRSKLNHEEQELHEKNVEDKIIDTNKSVTSTLKDTRTLMATSIIQTELSIEALNQQHDNLHHSIGLSDEFNDLLKNSKNIISFIEKQDKQDRTRIYRSFMFLGLCIAWIIWRRFLKLPFKILLWSMIKIFNIFQWMLPAPKAEDILESQLLVSTVSTIASISTIATISTINPSGSSQFDEIIMDIDTNDKVKTWQEIIETSTMIKDEL